MVEVDYILRLVHDVMCSHWLWVLSLFIPWSFLFLIFFFVISRYKNGWRLPPKISYGTTTVNSWQIIIIQSSRLYRFSRVSKLLSLKSNLILQSSFRMDFIKISRVIPSRMGPLCVCIRVEIQFRNEGPTRSNSRASRFCCCGIIILFKKIRA